MHAFRAFLLVVVILVSTSEGLFVKKALLKKAVAVKAGFLADVKAAALKFKAGAALKKAAVFGGFKALGKAKLGIISGIKAAKLKVLASIAAVKLAKLTAIKAAKLAFIKTLLAAKLAPFIAKKLAAKALIGKGIAAGALLKGKGDGKDDGKEKPGNFLLDGLTGLLNSASPLPLGDGADNPLISILGDLFLGALGGDQNNGGKKFDIGNILGSLGGLSAVLPQPASKPDINIQTYEVHPPPAVHTIEYESPAAITSYGVPVGSSSSSYVHPSTSYGVPHY